MDIRQLKYFCVLVEEKSYHKAAAKLYITQPALSQQISSLENELKAILIKRVGRQSMPTDAGLLLYKKAKNIIELTDSTKAEISNYNGNIAGSLRIGTSTMPVLLSDNVIAFCQKYPNIFLDIREGSHDTVMDYLNSGFCEIVITDLEHYDSNNLKRYQFDEQVFVFSGTKKYIPDGVTSLSFAKLKNVPLIINRTDYTMLKRHCLKYNYEPRIVAYVDATETKINLAKTGIGLSLGSEASGRLAIEQGLRTAKVDDLPEKIQRCVFWKDNYSLSAAASAFLSMLIGSDTYMNVK